MSLIITNDFKSEPISKSEVNKAKASTTEEPSTSQGEMKTPQRKNLSPDIVPIIYCHIVVTEAYLWLE